MLTGILAVVAAAEIGFWCGYSVGVAIWAVTEVVLHVAHGRGGHRALLWIAGWREAWRVRRRWPADWAIVAAKTSRVQAEVGSSKEPVAPARLRPIADHPKMSWWPRIDWPVASWWVGPPPGRSFAALEEVCGHLAANISHCVDVVVDFNRESDSIGRLVVTFADPLEATIDPTSSLASPEACWIGLLEADQRTGPSLMIVSDPLEVG